MALLLIAGVAACGSGDVRSASSGRATTHRVEPLHTAAPGVTATASGSTAPAARRSSTTTDEAPPPYIAKVVWVSLPSGRSLQVYPTSSGRVATSDGAERVAWREVLRKAPDAGTPGMRAQFDCHWAFARLAEPNKPSWNLEPWRPVVSAQRMYDTRCNPGGPEV